MPISQITPEEAEMLRKARAVRATESADLIALLEMLPRATSPEERHQLERMIARRGGLLSPRVSAGSRSTTA